MNENDYLNNDYGTGFTSFQRMVTFFGLGNISKDDVDFCSDGSVYMGLLQVEPAGTIID